MKLLKLFFCFTFVAVSTVHQAQSQIAWTLEQCISHALSHNIQIKQHQLNAQYSQNTYQQARYNRWPDLNAGADHSYRFGRSVDPYTNEFSEERVQTNNFWISSSVTLYDGLEKKYAIEQANYDLMARLSETEAMQNNVQLNIATAYLQILYNKERLVIAESELDITKEEIVRTKALIEAGSLPKGDLLEVEAQAAQEEVRLIAVDNDLNMSYLTLVQLLELDTAVADFKIAVPEGLADRQIEEETLGYTVEEVYQSALGFPQIKSTEYQLQSAEKSIEIAQAERLPELSFQATYYTGYSDARQKYEMVPGENTAIGWVDGSMTPVYTQGMTTNTLNYPFFDQVADNANTQLSLRLTIPIFNRYQVRTAIHNAQLNTDNARYEMQLAKYELYKDIQQAHADALAALAQYQGNIKAVDARQKAFDYTQEKFTMGAATSIEYNTAKNQLTQSRAEMLQAKYDYLFRKSILDFYAGNPLKL